MLKLILNEDNIRHFLIENGEVYMIREKNKIPSPERRHAVMGSQCGGIKPLGFDVTLELVNHLVTNVTYQNYLSKSGFNSVEAWREYVKRTKHMNKIRLYRVTICGPS